MLPVARNYIQSMQLNTRCVCRCLESLCPYHEHIASSGFLSFLVLSNSCFFYVVLHKSCPCACLITQALCHEDIWESGGIAPSFLTLALDGSKGSASRLGRFTPG
jgi:hypothetical protein